ncbi:MAG: response regulator [Cyanobacteria bacterium P01_F01_bin.150]
MKILLVDDDEDMVHLVKRRLKQDNYIVEVATDGEFAIDLLKASPYGLVLLDVMLPSVSGFDVCQILRNQGNQTPVLMLTGRNQITDKVAGLDAGADDYLVKPFQLDELTARVRALLRRNSEMASPMIHYGPLQFEPKTKALTYLEHPIELRPKELAILELMMRYPTQIFEPDGILDRLWNLADCPGKATVKTHIGSLRKQLATVGANDVIETVYGQGYRLNPAFLKKRLAEGLEEGLEERLEEGLETGNGNGTMPLRKEDSDSIASPPPQQETDIAPSIVNQTILDETWEQVQTSSWNRLCRLEALVSSSAANSMAIAPRPGTLANTDPESCKTAMAIAHKLKGILGTFGFQTASLQAEHIESLLSISTFENSAEVALLQDQVSILKQLLQPHISGPEAHQFHQGEEAHQGEEETLSAQNASMDIINVLVVAWDENWRQMLLKHSQTLSLHIQGCSPLNINECLLEFIPSVIVIELSSTERNVDLSLLDVLVSNYGSQVPILAAIESSRPDEQLVAIYHGANAIIHKTWSPQALLTMIAEYAE